MAEQGRLKVGDKVKVTGQGYSEFPTGSVFEVWEIRGRQYLKPIGIIKEGAEGIEGYDFKVGWFSEDELEGEA